MTKPDLSILIPARNEMFLARTVEDILANIEGNTEIIIVMDGLWSSPGVPDDPRVRIIYVSKNRGQRAATNLACRLSTAKYVMKVDAHCAFDKGFDRKMMEVMQDDWTMVPNMRNLHAFDWKCPKCGSQWYQGPTPTQCMKNTGKPGDGTIQNRDCDNTEGFFREMIWRRNRHRPNNFSYCFDATPHFQYFKEYSGRPEGQGNLTESMSLQGSCFMMTRAKYWELNICDENFGSWGSQGIEVAVKTWLSGGKVMANHDTWYAHLFRTQGLDFGFPYPISSKQIAKAKETAKVLFFENRWPLQKKPLSWLVERFWPIPGWKEADLKRLKEYDGNVGGAPQKGIIYYTDNRLKLKIAHAVQKNLKKMGLPIVSASLKPMSFGDVNILVPGERGYLTMFKQILAALEASTAEIIYFCEHDVLYHPSHFALTPTEKDKFYYNQNFWKVWPDGFVAHWDANQVSGLFGYREHLINFYRARIQEVEAHGFNRSYEPGGRDSSTYVVLNSEYPNIDIRHEGNLTNSHRRPEDFRDKSTCVNWKEATIETIPGWETLPDILRKL